ncbi:pro-sigmaK processing inhibitor BofA [Bacillaceae bacterium SIJ1]|uniref:pro-sigmaK processing inhibitor BofA family protein n=1 Tax=Litoribacterium kuwaitense TaxID=1398745 RepID=UPI0013EB8CAC|nr:pro-sigmaK processing inhibitor BofA family protein [Litoribacterium kuwaitense]NGP46672.1 pro-sigmaK processing inhibitor BofA [Litoribacterium kuwaitense]
MDPLWLLVIVPPLLLFLFVPRWFGTVASFAGRGIVKVMIGALFLFFLNTFFGHLGVHVPINLATAALSGFLGVPGVMSLAAISLFIM